MTKESVGELAGVAPLGEISYVRGTDNIPLSEVTVSQLLLDTAAAHPERPAAVFREQGIRWTWREFAAEVDILASGLLRSGAKPGARVGIWAPNRYEWVLTQFATARIGAIMVNINPAYRIGELEYALKKVDCEVLITAEKFRSSDYIGMLEELIPELGGDGTDPIRSSRLPALRTIIRMGEGCTPGMVRFSTVMAVGRKNLNVSELDAIGAGLHKDDAINIQFTSGTTGSPKGATLTHYNVVNNARFIADAMRFGEQDSLCIPVPLYHCFGMVLSVLVCVTTGAAMVFPGEGFEAGATLAALHDEKCTAIHGVPTMFIAQLDHPDFKKHDLSHLRTGIMAGAPCPVHTMNQVVAEMNLTEITIAYGMTETSPVSFQSATTDPLEKRTSTVGRVQPHLEVKLVDPMGEIVPLGEVGELCTRGYAVMKGYWGDVEKTTESIVDGWMHTGDLATFDSEGYCNVVGRLKDMLIRGGENIYPVEIEDVLFRHPAVQAVQVFGIPDEKYGEEVCAWIIRRPGQQAGADDIREFCRARMAYFKVPRYIKFVEELPTTVTGKGQKFIMRQRIIEELKV